MLEKELAAFMAVDSDRRAEAANSTVALANLHSELNSNQDRHWFRLHILQEFVRIWFEECSEDDTVFRLGFDGRAIERQASGRDRSVADRILDQLINARSAR